MWSSWPWSLLHPLSDPGRRSQPTRADSAQKFAQFKRIAHRVATEVVVEVHPDVAAVPEPLGDPLSPAPQFAAGVVAGIDGAVVRAVHPDVDKIGGGPRDTRQPRAAHHYISGAAMFQQLVDRRSVPRRMPQLDGHADRSRHRAQKLIEAIVVALMLRVQLNQQHAAAVTQ